MDRRLILKAGRLNRRGIRARIARCGIFALLLAAMAGCRGDEPTLKVREAAAEKPGLRLEEELPATGLRGYGQAAGALWTGPDGSILSIECEDEAKARLTRAKYLSDLRTTAWELAPDSILVRGTSVETLAVRGQGWIAALRSGTRVLVLAAPERAGLERLLAEGLEGDLKSASSAANPETEIPMWLDRWDQFGFRFYYRPWELPGDEALRKDYDFSREFDFAEAMDRCGFVFWGGPNQVDTGEGTTNQGLWNFAAKAAAARRLPAGLNITVGGPGMGWFHNRFRDQDAAKMPQYCGASHDVANSYFGGSGFTSWNATTAEDANLGLLQPLIADMASRGNLTTILEPHGELRHGDYDLFMEYGPVADRTFRAYLRETYRSVTTLNRAWGAGFDAWEDVRVPEVASFLGWGDEARDLSGVWRIRQVPEREAGDPAGEDAGDAHAPTAPPEWFAADYDDSSWPAVTAPGHDRTMFLPKRPAVYRQTAEVPESWLRGKEKVWLYCWDLNRSWEQPVRLYLNGKLAREEAVRHPVSHWMAVDVSDFLKPGANQISLLLPSGYLAYRIYLSPEPPLQYPALGPEKNARWVDFMGWLRRSRVTMARRGMEMIRQVNPDIQIDLMAPGGYEDGVRQLALRYGGNFKNTGYMGVFWDDNLPSHMRGAGLPFSLEPGGPAATLAEFKKQMGLYQTEGIQGLDYFIHIGSILWNDDIRSHFERTLKMTRFLGKHHPPRAETAFFRGTRNQALVGYPWGNDPEVNLPSGYNCKETGNALLWRGWPRDIVSESDFTNGVAARYPVIIDTNTSILDDETLAGIEAYVRGGGTFVTFVQTGRHTPTQPDSWPISKLSGYEVLSWDPSNRDDKSGAAPQPVTPAADQPVFPADGRPTAWMRGAQTGLRLKKTAEDARDLLLWKDGTVAAGMRPLGAGHLIQFGPRAGSNVWPAVPVEALEAILRWKGVRRTPGHLEGAENGNQVLMRHSVSNNGLYHVWALWNRDEETPVEAGLKFDDPAVATGIEIETETALKFPAGALSGLKLDPLQTRLFLTPRGELTRAPLRWFRLQRDWWRATGAPPEKPLPKPPHRWSVDLSRDWAFRPLADGENGADFARPETDDSAWERMSLDIWTLPDKRDIRHAILRKTFTAPERWKDGEVELWIQCWHHSTFVDRGRIWLDGKLIRDWDSHGLDGKNPDGAIAPGTTHTVAIEIEAKGALAGSRGPAWLWCWPRAEATLDLSGEWRGTRDAMNYGEKVAVPGPYDARGLRRTVVISEEHAGRKALFDCTVDGHMLGVLINGHWVRRFHHMIGNRFQLDLTPWVRFGEENELEIVHRTGPGRGEIREVSLRFYGAGQGYP